MKKNLLSNLKKSTQELLVSFVIILCLVSSLITILILNARKVTDQNKAATIPAGLYVNESNVVNNFSNNMLGLDYVNWEHSWGKPFLGSSGLSQLTALTQDIHPGIIRYAGGLWANSVGWNRQAQQNSDIAWKCGDAELCYYTDSTGQRVKDTSDYYFRYGPEEIDSLAQYKKDLGAEVMIQVNISNYNPSMWADMVKYVNVEKSYGFKYWELGNELDFDSNHRIDPTVYKTRLDEYAKAMKAIDPTIKIIGADVSTAVPEGSSALSPFITESVKSQYADSISYHWYQNYNIDTVNKITDYQYYVSPGVPGDGQDGSNRYYRRWGEFAPVKIKSDPAGLQGKNLSLGVTELNTDANSDNPVNGAHITALWFTDVLGRMAYYGVDYATMYEGYGTQALSLLYPSSTGTTYSIAPRPTYYAYYMYANFFGNKMVQSHTDDPEKISIWASIDSNDSNKLKIMVTNLSDASINKNVTLANSNATTGKTYTMKTTSAISDFNANDANAGTSINGVKISAVKRATVKDDMTSKAGTVNVVNGSFSYDFPAYSTTAIVFENGTPVTTTSTSVTTTTSTSVATTTTTTTSINADCLCQTNSCSTSCAFDKIVGQTYSDSISCQRESSIKGTTPNSDDQNGYCNRQMRLLGDANGDGKVNNLDYYYYLRSVIGGEIPSYVNPDFTGDGRVSSSDRELLITQLLPK